VIPLALVVSAYSVRVRRRYCSPKGAVPVPIFLLH
jgi:hypothetical protein